MRLVFAGTPDFAVPALEALIKAGHDIAAVYTQPDRPAGRGRALRPSQVKASALAHNLPVYQPETLKDKNTQDELAELGPEAMIVIAYGLILPKAVLEIPTRGCINIHASLLPRWRGAAPIQRAIQEGDTTTGITIMQMDAGLDTGDMLLKKEITISPIDTGGSLHDRLATLGADAIVETLEKLKRDELKPQKQNEKEASYAAKLSKDEGWLDFGLSADALSRRIRAFDPWPGTRSHWQGKPLSIIAAHAEDRPHKAAPGTVLAANAEGIALATGRGALVITRLKPAGKKAQDVSAFLNGHALDVGTVLD